MLPQKNYGQNSNYGHVICVLSFQTFPLDIHTLVSIKYGHKILQASCISLLQIRKNHVSSQWENFKEKVFWWLGTTTAMLIGFGQSGNEWLAIVACKSMLRISYMVRNWWCLDGTRNKFLVNIWHDETYF